MRYPIKLSLLNTTATRQRLFLKHMTTMPNTSNLATEQGQSAAATREVEQSTTETVSANDASKAENSTDSGASQEQRQQTGPGPKVLRSHFRGMPSQWEKNQRK